MAIYHFLRNTKSHPNAEKIYSSIKEEYPGMSLATIYKTLETLKKAFLIQELNVGENGLRYDADTSTHPHFFCKECNEVYDLESNSTLEELRQNIIIPSGFEIEAAQIYLFGKCQKCTGVEIQ